MTTWHSQRFFLRFPANWNKTTKLPNKRQHFSIWKKKRSILIWCHSFNAVVFLIFVWKKMAQNILTDFKKCCSFSSVVKWLSLNRMWRSLITDHYSTQIEWCAYFGLFFSKRKIILFYFLLFVYVAKVMHFRFHVIYLVFNCHWFDKNKCLNVYFVCV